MNTFHPSRGRRAFTLVEIMVSMTILAMLSGFMDDRSDTPWGEYRKAAIDLVLSVAASAALFYLRKTVFWLPFVGDPIAIGAFPGRNPGICT